MFFLNEAWLAITGDFDLVCPGQAPSYVHLVKASQGDFDFVNTYLIDLWHGCFDLLSILIFLN